MFALDEFIQDIGLIAELALVAVKQGDEDSAKKLFNVIGLLDPVSTTKAMGYGLIAVHKMDIAAAQKHFNEVLKQEPENWRALAFTAFTHMLALINTSKTPLSNEQKRTHFEQSIEIANRVLKNEEVDASTKQLAQSILDWHRDLQGTASKMND